MKKSAVVLGSVLALLLGSCIPGLTPTPGTGPTVDTVGTSDALFKTAVAQTLTAQPTFTSGSVTDTPTVTVASPVLSATDTQTATQTFTPLPDLTTTPATATSGPLDVSFTATLAAGQVTASPTLGIRKYGTLPPLVPFSRISLVNKAKAEAYISLQVTMKDGRFSIIEYPVQGTVKIDAPVGSYLYVAWVGGRKMVGNFKLHENDQLTITLFKDRVVIK